MIAVDTNLLVYAHRADSQWSDPARQCLRHLAENRSTWAIPWPCIHEFLAIVTHPRIYAPPSTLSQAVEQVDAWFGSESIVLLGESSDHWAELKGLLGKGQVQGPLVHDARIAALCLTHGVTELLTADRDFSRFPGLTTRNPLLV